MKKTLPAHIIQTLFHPAIRPMGIGLLMFVAFNILFTLGVTFSPLNAKFNFSYGNFLPAKLAMLKQQVSNQNGQHPEVLFLGTSQTNNGFIPKVFEQATEGHLSSFNLGLPNNRYDIMQAYLQFHQKHYGKPKLVLIELSPSIQEKDASLYFLPALYYRTLIEQSPTLTSTYLKNPLLAENVKHELLLSGLSSLRQYRYTFSPVNVVRKVSEKANGLTDKISGKFNPIATHNLEATEESGSLNETPNNNQSEKLTISYQSEWMEQGWYPKPQSPHMTYASGITLSVQEARKYYIDQQNAVHFDKLKALLTYCQREEIPVALVSWPNHPAFLTAFQRSPLHRTYQQGLRELLAQSPVPVINLSDDIPATQSATQGGYFADPRHLTPEGAQYFSRKLAQRLLVIDGMEALLKTGKSNSPLAKQSPPTNANALKASNSSLSCLPGNHKNSSCL